MRKKSHNLNAFKGHFEEFYRCKKTGRYFEDKLKKFAVNGSTSLRNF